MLPRMRASPRPLTTFLLGLTFAAISAAPALAADPSPAPSAAPDGGISSRGTHCVECYLFWDPIADARAVLDVPVAVAAPAWLATDLIAPDGSMVRLSDLAGHPVIVELMATWCASCADQQAVLRDARADLPADTVILSLDVDPAGDPSALDEYAAEHGFDWTFASAPVSLLRTLAQTYGDDAINPAATPLLVIDRDGRAWMPPLGHKDRAAVADLLSGA